MTDSIQRYDQIDPYEDGLIPCEDGEYVKYDDHLNAVQSAVEAAVLQECEACAQVCESAENEWGTQLQNGDVFAAMLRGD